MENIFESLENLNISEECFDEIMGIVEEIINEVSVKRWRQAAINSLSNRAEENVTAGNQLSRAIRRKASNKVRDKYGEKAATAEERLQRAKEIATTMRDSKRPANKVVRAAKKSVQWREDNISPEEFHKNFDKWISQHQRERHAEDLSNRWKV